RTATPASRIRTTCSNTVDVVLGSRPIDGSSSSTTSGLTMSERANSTCFCCPPDSRPASCFHRSPTMGKRFCTNATRSAIFCLSRRVYAPRSTFSATVISRNTLWPWSTCARPDCSISCGPWPVTSRPPTRTRPERGLSSPLATLSTVDLPAPFGPTRHTTVAAGTRIVRPRSTIAARPYPAWTSSSSRRYSCVAPAPGVGSDTKVGLQDSRVGLHDGGGPLGDRPAPVEHDDVVGQAHDHVHVVLDDEE